MPLSYVTAEELARRLLIRPSTVRRWARENRIPSVRPSHKVLRFDPVAVDRALRQEERVALAFELAESIKATIDSSSDRLAFDRAWRRDLLTKRVLSHLDESEIETRLREVLAGLDGGNDR